MGVRVNWLERDQENAGRHQSETFADAEEADDFVKTLMQEDPRRRPEIVPCELRTDDLESEEA